MLPPNFKIEFIQGYQDKKTQCDRVPITGKLNVETKQYSTKYTSLPKNSHIILTPMSIYINNIYIPTRIDCAIRKHSYATEAKTFLCAKYKWTSATFDTIKWKQNSFTLMNMSSSQRRMAIRFMHHRLSTGKMKFTAPYPCPYCNHIFDQSSNHDNFLTCKKITQNKDKRIDKLEDTMKN